MGRRSAALRLGRALYRARSFTPLPLVALVLARSRPTVWSALAGLPLVVLGEGERLEALRSIGGASRSLRVGGDRLVTEGAYARTRNPLYFGNLILSTGLALLSGVPYLPPLLWLLFAAQYVPIILCEEEELAGRHPEPYAAYTARVPRFFPRTWRRSPSPGRHGFLEAVRIEKRTLAAIAMLVAAMFVRGRLAGEG
jgi:protein-S-isoprenylcysteine O-methyltransferase Ste14